MLKAALKLFVFIFLFSLSKILIPFEEIIGDNWAYSNLLINYSSGFVKRGLLGQIFIYLNNNFNTFEIEDEVYHNLYLEPDSKPFLKAKTYETNEEHIVGWTYNYENGKVVYNALGHDSKSLLEPEMVNIIKKSVKWVSGDKNA